jgi:hypothetical protein
MMRRDGLKPETSYLLVAAAFAFVAGLGLLLAACGSPGNPVSMAAASPAPLSTRKLTPRPTFTPSPTPLPPPITITLVHSNDTWGYTLPCG